MSKKSTAPKHRAQVDKALRNISKPVSKIATSTAKTKPLLNVDPTLVDQYKVIKKDFLKLRDDISRGYDLAKSEVEKKGFVKKLLFSTK